VGSCPDYSSVSYPIHMVQRKRELPLPGEVLVQEGTLVEPDHQVAKISLKPGIPWVIPLHRLLGIEPQSTSSAMLVQVGETVSNGQIIARAQGGLYGRKEYAAPIGGTVEHVSDASGRLVIREEFGREEPPINFDVAFELGCRPADIPNHMLVDVGQEVKRGAIIAKKGEASAFFTRTALAPISGLISEIDSKTGYATISRPFREVVVKAYLSGRVSRVLPEYGVNIESPGVVVNGAFGVGPEAHGDLVVLSENIDCPLTDDMITADLAGKVVVVGSHATNEALSKALENGVRGVVCATASYLHLVQALGVKLGVGITGQEDIGTTVILMEGFGQLTMRRHAFEALRQLDGQHVSINGRTQIRAGAIRPEVVCTFPDYDGELGQPSVLDEDLYTGARVRVISDPYFGRLGEIVDMPRDSRSIGTEASVPVIMIRFDDAEGDEPVMIPRKNVELF